MLTPPLVSTASQRAAPSTRRRSISPSTSGDPQVHRHEPVPAQQRHQRAPVGVADLAREQRTASFDQLVTGREHTDDGGRHDRHSFPSDTAQHAEVAGAEDGPRREHLLAGGHVLARPAHVLAGCGGGHSPQTWSPTLGSSRR